MNFFYYESKFKIKKKYLIFWGGGGGRGPRVSEFFLQRIQI